MDTVSVAGREVLMGTAAELRAEASLAEAAAEGARTVAARLRADADARLVEVGMILLARETEWAGANPSAGFQLAEARDAIARVDELGVAGSKTARGSRRTLFARRAPREEPGLIAERDRRAAQLRLLLADLGRGFGGALGAVDGTHARAMEMDDRALARATEAGQLSARAAALESEAAVRDRSVAEFGFDAPLAAAQLQVGGAPSLESPLELRAGEVAHLVAEAELARERSFAVAVDAVSAQAPPVEVTGIRFALGARHDRPLVKESLSLLGPGRVVVTNQRVGVVGKLKSFAFPLSDLARVDLYSNGVSMLRAGRPNADVVLTASPGRLLFMINWAIAAAPGD